MTSITLSVGGRVLTLTDADVRAAVEHLSPQPPHTHVVAIDETVFPVKQAFSAATGLDLLDFNTNQARSTLKRLGFDVRRIGGDQK